MNMSDHSRKLYFYLGELLGIGHSFGNTVMVGAGNGEFDWKGKFDDFPNYEDAYKEGLPSEPFMNYSWTPRYHKPDLAPWEYQSLFDMRTTIVEDNVIEANVEIAKTLWAQACIFINWDGNIIMEDAPYLFGADMLLSGSFNLFNSLDFDKAYQLSALFNHYKSTMSPDIIDFFVVGHIETPRPVGGVTVGPEFEIYGNLPLAEVHNGIFTYVILNGDNIERTANRTLAHEIGHVLTGWTDNIYSDDPILAGIEKNRSVFFPQDKFDIDSSSPGYDVHPDVGSYRRLRHETIKKARQSPFLK